MDCKTFTELLPRYLAGDLSEAEFSRMVAHETQCETCAALAVTAMDDTAADNFATNGNQAAIPTADDFTVIPSAAESQDNWLAETLERTLGADCRYIETQIAATFDGEALNELSRRHLSDCPNCQAMARMMVALPEFYAAYPRLRADNAFVKEVMRLTIGKVPSVWDVFRALVRRPEAILEGALACALIAAPFAGDMPMQIIEKANNARKAIVEQVGLDDISTNIDRKLIDADTHFQEIRSQRNTALKSEYSKARNWVERQVDLAEVTVTNLTDTDPTTGSPTAKVVSWTERALGHVGLIDSTATNTTTPANTPGTQ